MLFRSSDLDAPNERLQRLRVVELCVATFKLFETRGHSASKLIKSNLLKVVVFFELWRQVSREGWEYGRGYGTGPRW